MILNPFYITVILYITTNLYAATIGIYNKGMEIEGVFFHISPSSILVSITFQISILLLFSLLYTFLKRKSPMPTLVLKDIWAYSLILLQIFFIFFNISNNVNIAGSGNTLRTQSLTNIFFILLQPDILYLIIGLHLRSNKLFWLNTIIFIISMTTRGWMGGIYLVFLITLIRYYPIQISKKKLKLFIFLAIVGIIFLPTIIELKWAMRSGESIFTFLSKINIINNIYSIDKSLDYVANRFQHIGHVSLFFENMNFYYHEFIKSSFIPFWLEGLPQTIFLKLFSYDVTPLSHYAVSVFFNIDSPTWNINTGLVSWIFITQEYSPLILIYLLFFYILPLTFFNIMNFVKLFNLISVFSVLYLFHGWFSAYFTLLIYVFIFLLLVIKSKNIKYTHS